jgi:hypothetical protein
MTTVQLVVSIVALIFSAGAALGLLLTWRIVKD